MSPEDLLKMLDLAGADATPSGESVLRSESEATAVSPHATALEVDDWGLRRGRELV